MPYYKEDIQSIIDGKAKPLGALGDLERIALQAAQIQQSLHPSILNPHIIVFAGDHGIAATGKVNPYPQAITAAMVHNFVQGGAAINALCKINNIQLEVVDAGVVADFPSDLPIHHFKIAKGTRNYENAPAMDPEQLETALQRGRSIVQMAVNRGCNTIGFGEMGIGNTASASLLMSAFTGMPIRTCVGRGTGANDEQLKLKTETLAQVVRFHPAAFSIPDPHTILATVGGFEMAMMTGAYLEAFAQNILMVVDGFIATASLLAAHAMEPKILSHCVFAHCSGEQGHQKMLDHLRVKPLLQLGMRLGEGTGAAMAIPILRAAMGIFEMRDLKDL